jgi:hypothetical protein
MKSDELDTRPCWDTIKAKVWVAKRHAARRAKTDLIVERFLLLFVGFLRK